MFNKKTLPTRDGSIKVTVIDDFSSVEGINYNVRETENGIESGYGFKRLLLPTSAAGADVQFNTNATAVLGAWQFTWYDNTDNVDKYYIYYINESKQLKYINILGKKSIYQTGITLNSATPSCATFRINNDNDMIFFSSPSDDTVGHGGSGKQVFDNIPKFISACWHGPYLFLITTGAANKLMYSTSKIDIWNDDNTAEVAIPDLRGGMKKIISVNDYLYLFYEYGVVKLSLYSVGAKVSYSHIFSSTAQIYENTIAKCGNSVYFLTTEGLFALENGQVKRMDKQPRFIKEKNSTACAECFDGKYFLACVCDFGDSKKIGIENQTYTNNAIIVFDAATQKYSYTRGIDIQSFFLIKTPIMQRLCATTRGTHKGHFAQLTYDGKFFGEDLPKCWQSKPLDFGSLDQKEFLQLEFGGKTIGDMNISSSRRSCTLKMSHTISQPIKYKIKLFGDQFTLSFSSSAELSVSYPRIKVKHLS